MLDKKKENNTVCSSINSPSSLLTNVFVSVYYLGFNIKLHINTAGGIFLPDGENLRRSDFDESDIFQSYL